MKTLGISISRKARAVLAVWAVGIFLLVFVSIALFLWLRVLRTFVVTTFRVQVDSAGNWSLTPKVPDRLWGKGLWALDNAVWIGLALAAQFYLNRSLVAILVTGDLT